MYTEQASYWVLGNRGSIPGKGRELPFWTASKPALRSSQSYPLGVGHLSLWLNRPGHEASLSCLYSLQPPTHSLFANITGDTRNTFKNFTMKSKAKRKLGDLGVDGNVLLK
jgi:hypothetical protein